MNRVLLTGSEGYVGRVVQDKLTERGYEVVGMDISSTEPMDIQYVRDLPDVDVIIHLAGISQEPTARIDPRKTDLINHIATENLAKLARQNGIKFVFASSCSVYFTYDTPLEPEPYKEDDPISPISPYAISKVSAENSLLELAKGEFQPVILRKGTVYGVSPNMRTDVVLNHFVEDVVKKGVMTVHGGGNIWRPMADIQDVAEAYIRALGDMSGIYNVVTKNWNILEMAKEVQSLIGGDIDVQDAGVVRNYLASGDKLNLEPKREFKEAVLELYDHFYSRQRKMRNIDDSEHIARSWV